jgi:hypothetical protein
MPPAAVVAPIRDNTAASLAARVHPHGDFLGDPPVLDRVLTAALRALRPELADHPHTHRTTSDLAMFLFCKLMFAFQSTPHASFVLGERYHHPRTA